MQILVDGDILVYRAGFATEYPKYTVVWDDEFAKEFQYKKEALKYQAELVLAGLEPQLNVETILEPVQNALHIVDSMIGGIAHQFGVSNRDLTVVLSGKENFRNEVAFTKPYKGNRTKPKPVHYHDVRKHMVEKYATHITDNEEADDYMGYSQYTTWFFDPEGSVIVTIDKDLDMIAGQHYNPVTEEHYYVDEDEADRFFLHQLIMGDPTDNIPGIPGMAEVKAANFLEDVPTSEGYAQIRELYINKFGEEGCEIFNEQASLLWIRRAPHQVPANYWDNQL